MIISQNNRYTSKEEARETLKAYIEGARYGVVGHFTNYPLSSPKLDFEPKKIIKEYITDHNPTGIYIHWPYCYLPHGIEKCDFCMCNTMNDNESLTMRKQYFKSLLNEITTYSELMQGKPVEWLYIGGGTPLTMSVSELDVLFGTLYELNLINQDTYISLESRPEVITPKKIDLLKKYNVSRLSMGVESFDEKTVVSMGRIRKGLNYYEIVTKAVNMIREAKIKYFNLDFIYSHPLDELETVLDSISKALDFTPDSLSIYSLGLPFQRTTIEKDVIEGRDIKSLDFRLRCFTLINETLKENGYHMVSDSIWSRNKMYSHKRLPNNEGIVNFWNQTCTLPFGLWIPIGVGSIGFLENYGPIQNTYSITQYIELIENGNLGMVKGTQHSLEELMRSEMVISVLHRIIDVARFIDKYHVHPTDVFPTEFSLLTEMGLIEETDSEIRLTEQAIPVSQGIARFFISKVEESKYRESEKHRIDYKIYNVSYQHLT